MFLTFRHHKYYQTFLHNPEETRFSNGLCTDEATGSHATLNFYYTLFCALRCGVLNKILLLA